MSRSRKKPKKTPRGSGQRKPPRAATAAPEAAGPKRRSPLLLFGLAAVVVVAVAAVLVLRPDGTDERPAPAEPAARATSDLDLRNEAFDVVKKLLSDFPRSADPPGLMGTVQNQFGNSVEAEKWWWRCLELDPKRVDIYEVLAVAYLRKGEYEKVGEVLERAEALEVQLPGVHLRYAEALLELGRMDEALMMLEKELEVSPDLTEAWIALGKIRIQRREYDLAVEAYAEASRRRPSLSQPYYGLATASARMGQREKSREYMETFKELRAVEDEASTTRRRATDQMRPVAQILAQVLTDAGKVYQAHQQYEQAEAYWRRAGDLDRKDTPSRIQLVNRYRSTDRGVQALEVCEQLVRIEPDNARYHLVRGITLADLGQYAAARDALRKATELDPDDPQARKLYRQLMEK